MSVSLVNRILAATCAIAVLGATAIVVNAQTPPDPRVIASEDGMIFMVLGRAAWVVTPVQLSDSELGNLNVVGEVDGTLPAQLLSRNSNAPVPTGARLAQGPDGTLFVVQGTTAWGLVPGEIDDPSYPPLNASNYSVLTFGQCVTYYNKSLDGLVPPPILTGVLPFEAEAGIALNPCVPGAHPTPR